MPGGRPTSARSTGRPSMPNWRRAERSSTPARTSPGATSTDGVAQQPDAGRLEHPQRRGEPRVVLVVAQHAPDAERGRSRRSSGTSGSASAASWSTRSPVTSDEVRAGAPRTCAIRSLDPPGSQERPDVQVGELHDAQAVELGAQPAHVRPRAPESRARAAPGRARPRSGSPQPPRRRFAPRATRPVASQPNPVTRSATSRQTRSRKRTPIQVVAESRAGRRRGRARERSHCASGKPTQPAAAVRMSPGRHAGEGVGGRFQRRERT